ncbi:MAG TPA: dihydrofolate reductase family protein [Candidatus Limnocylindria bacterium]|jgi:dihydrofolate reductase
MGRLIYCLNVSLDGFIEGPDHEPTWADVGEELHRWFNDRARGIEASLYGRRMYELMADAWPTIAKDASAPGYMHEFAETWLATPRYVFSTTLASVAHNSTLVRGDPRTELARIRERHHGDLEIAGPTLAAAFIRAGLVDEYQLLVHPIVLGGGTPFFPPLVEPLRLRLVESRVVAGEVQLLAYRPAS